MSESIIVAIIGFFGIIAAAIISFHLGQRAERVKQSITIKVAMLIPIDEWLKGVEKMVGILGDTISTVVNGLPMPVSYNLEERKNAFNFMSEKTNEIIGILSSNCLITRKTRHHLINLKELIESIDTNVRYKLLPLENGILESSRVPKLCGQLIQEGNELQGMIDSMLQKAYSLEAQIKTSLL